MSNHPEQYPTRKANLTFTEEIVTPERAAQWLMEQEHNRPMRKTALKAWEKRLREDDVKVTAQPLVLDWNGKLMNGQHRCQACVNTGIPFQTVVARGENPAHFIYYDTGTPRYNSDHLAIAGIANYRDVPGILAIVRLFDERPDKSWQRQAVKMDAGESIHFASLIPDVSQYASFGAHARHAFGKIGHQPVFGATAYILSRDSGYPHDMIVKKFWEPMFSGAGLDEGDPRLVFTKKLIRDYKASQGSTTEMMRPWIGMLIKTFNKWATQQDAKVIAMSEGEHMPSVVPFNKITAMTPTPLMLARAAGGSR